MNDSELISLIVFPTVVILLLLIGVLVAVFKASRDRVRHEVQLSQIELAFQKELRDAENEVGEYLRSHFSRELHDNVGHTLTYMRLHIENAKLDVPGNEEIFAPLEKLLDNASNQVRLLSRSMNTEFLNNTGFASAVHLEVRRLQAASEIQISVLEGDDELLSGQKDKEIMAFRIFQEIITNILKHAKAKKILIELNLGKTILSVKDDGVGFDLEQIRQSGKSNGINNILKRAQLSGLICTIETKPGEGCRYNLQIN